MKIILKALKIFLFFTIVTGVIYPLLVTGIAQMIFPSKANGSLIIENDKVIGSELIGQTFDSAYYFTSRPSAISYNPMPSGGSNLGLTNIKLKNLAEARKKKFIVFNGIDSNTIVPADMVFASGSGIDPHISPDAALLQINRIVAKRNFSDTQKKELKSLIQKHTEAPQFGLLGEKRVNVLKLNLALDQMEKMRAR